MAIPDQVIGDVDQAAKAAGCKLDHLKLEGAQHEERDFTEGDYKTNPPTSGNHFPTPAADGVYPPDGTPPLGQVVHTLEHDRIDVQYKPGTPQETIDELNALLAEMNDGYHLLLFENQTTWTRRSPRRPGGHSLTCPEMNDKVFDAIRTFRNEYIDKGPEPSPGAGLVEPRTTSSTGRITSRSAPSVSSRPAISPFSSRGWRTVVAPAATTPVGDVVEPDDGQVLGHADARLPGRIDDAEGELVGGGDHGRRPLIAVERALCREVGTASQSRPAASNASR